MNKQLSGVGVMLLWMLCLPASLLAQTAGTLTFKFTQVAQSPTYSGSRNALAVWIQTGSTAGGTFVKTKMRYAGPGQGTSDHLPTFSIAAGGTANNCMSTAVNVTDATTGATLTSFGTRTITWDGKNVSGTNNGTVVPDGVYSVAVQETWNHGTTGTTTAYFSFTKGPDPVNTTFPNTSQFSNITLVWTPTVSNSITTGTISGGPFCAGQTGISIPYTATGTFNAGNVFTAQLSNASGSFASPVTLGTLTSTALSGTITSNVALPSTTGTGYRIRVVSSNPSTTGSDNGANLTISAAPTTANAGSAQSVCAGSTATLAGNTPVTGTGTWTRVSGSGNITNPSNPASTVTGPGTGANTFRWTIASGSCTSTSDVVITGIAPPTTANAGTAQSVCGTSATLGGNSPASGTGMWTRVSGSGTIANPSGPASAVTGLTVGDNVFRWTISNAPCAPSSSDVVITGVAAPTTANAGSAQSVCGTTATLAGNTPVAGTGTWTRISGAGTVTNPSSPASTVTGLGTGANVFRWTIGNAPCAASTSDVTITGIPAPTTADAGPAQSVCGTSATLAGNSPVSGTGTWSRVSGAGTVTNPSSATSTVTGLGTGPNTFRWTITSGNCTPSTSDVIITGVANPTTANAGANQTVCATSATLSGNTPATGSGTWTRVSGAGTITNPSNPATTVTGLAAGTNVFRWTISNAPCTASSADVIITQTGTLTAADAGPDQEVCGTSATLAGNAPTVGTGTWTRVSGSGTITNPSSPTSAVTGLGVGPNTFRWTISNGACTPSTSDVVITGVASPTTANAGTNQTVCATTVTLAGNTPVSGTGTWTRVSGSGTITNPTSPTSAVTDLGPGANTFRWTIANAPCAASTADVVITQSGAPTAANAGPAQSVCGTSATLGGNAPATGTGTWSRVSGSGTITDPSSPNSTVTGLGTGPNTFRWTITSGTCTSTSDVTITGVTAPTPANAGPAQGVCGTSTTLAGNTPVSGTGTWTKVSGFGTITNPSDPNTTVTGLGMGANTFRWTITSGNCPSSYSDVVISGVAAPTPANAGTDQTICSTATTLSGNTPSNGTGMWSRVSGTGIISNPANPNTTVTGLGTGSSVFRWTISNAPCTASFAEVTISNTCANNTISTGAITGGPFCSSTSYSLMINYSTSGTFSGYYTAELSDAAGSFANPVVIGATSSGPISAVIPAGTAPGNGYRIRVANTSPVIKGSDNGADISINTCVNNSITTGVISGSPFCGNTSNAVNVPFSSTGTYSGLFTAELSDARGGFSNPVIIGYSATTPVQAIIPSETAPGSNYRIRVRNSSPATTGTDNGSDLEINTCVGIVIDSVPGKDFGPGTTYSFQLPFTVLGSLSGPFIVELSDVSGNFTTPTTIGYGYSSPVFVTIPANTPPGNSYRIRVVDYATGTEGNDNGSNISINKDLVSGIFTSGHTNAIAVYPNPNGGSFEIRHPFSGSATVTVLNVLGEKIYQQHATMNMQTPCMISIDNISKGVYILKIEADNKVYQTTMMVY